MHKLLGELKCYPWGSRTRLAQLTGRPAPSAQPEAELWYGAHPAGPSQLAGVGLSLLDLINEAPEAELGGRVVKQFGPTLPFLLKLLAADEPLSLQAHPSQAQAQAGFARENAVGLSPDDPKRNYRDANHKPELLVALTDFEALAGFAEPDQISAFFHELGIPFQELGVSELFPATGGLAAAARAWLRLSPEAVAPLVAQVRAASLALSARGGKFTAHARVLADLAGRHPQDPGVLVAGLMNHIRLKPGEGLFIPDGVLHAHLGGLGVEVMANSDNVLRGGLTTKHVDVDELLAVVDFAPTPLRFLVSRGEEAGGTVQYATRAEEFGLGVFHLAAGQSVFSMGGSGPKILLCVCGGAQVRSGENEARLAPGEAVWLGEGDSEMLLTGNRDGTTVFRASVPDMLFSYVR